jgi:hypothetical protein
VAAVAVAVVVVVIAAVAVADADSLPKVCLDQSAELEPSRSHSRNA